MDLDPVLVDPLREDDRGALAAVAALREKLALPAVARALGLEDESESSLEETLAEHVHDKELLLILDGFEQVSAAAPSIGAFLRAAPRVKALITSRERLNLYGEHEYDVLPGSVRR